MHDVWMLIRCTKYTSSPFYTVTIKLIFYLQCTLMTTCVALLRARLLTTQMYVPLSFLEIFFKDNMFFEWPDTFTTMPFLYHDAVGAGLPPLLLHRHRTSSPSFTLKGVEQLVTANGCTEKKMYLFIIIFKHGAHIS